jgi:hypothetical protein
MSEPERIQSPRSTLRAFLAIVGSAGILLLAGHSLFGPVGTDVAHRQIKLSARMPVLFWCFSWPFMFARRRRELVAFPIIWAQGCLFLWLHIAIAFHLGHGWSHEAAWEHTREIGGYGDGIYVNYAFALIWLADVIWAWTSPDSYLTRPRWLHWAIHGFLAFVVFNAAVVFADWAFRLTFIGWVLFLALVARYLQRKFPATQTVVSPSANPDMNSNNTDRP